PAAGSSFGAGEARHMSGVAFVRQISDIFAIFPQGHALIVMSPVILLAHPMRIANEQRANVFFTAKVNHLPRGFMTHITNTPFYAATLFVFRVLQLFPAFGIFLAMALLFGMLAQVVISLSLQRAIAAPGHSQG